MYLSSTILPKGWIYRGDYSGKSHIIILKQFIDIYSDIHLSLTYKFKITKDWKIDNIFYFNIYLI